MNFYQEFEMDNNVRIIEVSTRVLNGLIQSLKTTYDMEHIIQVLQEYLDEIILSLRPRLKKTRHEIIVECVIDDDCDLGEICSGGSCVASEPVCGDGVLEGDEVCERGYRNDCDYKGAYRVDALCIVLENRFGLIKRLTHYENIEC